MKKEVIVKVDKVGDKVIVSNNLGMRQVLETNKVDYMVASLVGLTMAEFFQDSNYLMQEFQMTLYVEGLEEK